MMIHAQARSGARLPAMARVASIAIGLLVVTAACSGTGPATASSAGGAPPATTSTVPTDAPASAEPSAAPGSATVEPALIEPPVAELRHGGVAADGALGSFSFRETGQAAPWLPGTAIALPAGAPLEIGLVPPVPVESWSAAVVPAADLDETAAVAMGGGTGPIRFDGPASGSWSVMVAVRFADGQGSASYYWAVIAE
jgi:hypothetical protein